VTQDGKIAEDGVLLLGNVVNPQSKNENQNDAESFRRPNDRANHKTDKNQHNECEPDGFPHTTYSFGLNRNYKRTGIPV